MAQFKVTPEYLKNSSSNIKSIRTGIQNTLQDVEAEMKKMKNDWESEAANAFISKFLGLKDNFEAYYKVMDQYSNFLNSTAEAYGKADDSINKASNDLFS